MRRKLLLSRLTDQQRQLATSEQRLSLALEATGDGLWDFNRGERPYLSASFCHMLGYTPDGDELQPAEWFKLVHPEDRPATEAAVTAVRSAATDLLAVELRMRTAAGDWKWIFLRGRVIARTPEGPPQRMIGTVQDIDQRRVAEAESRERQELFRNAFEESAVGMALVRPDGTLIRVNEPFCQIVGYTADELIARSFQDITHPDDLDEDVAFLKALLRNERQHYSMEKRYVRKDGSLVWAMLNVGVVLDAAQKPLYLISQVQDITQRKRNEEDLRAYAQRLYCIKEELERSTAELAAKSAEAEAAKLAAEQATRTKSAFLANMSHEIRTPMAAIIGFANLMLDDRLPDAERARCVETIGRNGQHLLAVINDILDLSKIEAGKMTVEAIDCDLAELLADVEAMMRAQAAEKRLSLRVGVASDVPRRVRTDPTRLRQVLLNLVSNAIKFTHEGGVTVDLDCVTESDGVATLRLVVTDSGIGMTDEQTGRLFESFGQADVSTTRRFGGTGLGLAISKRLVEMMNGHLLVSSEVGLGSRFGVTLSVPVVRGSLAASPAEKRVPITPRRGLRVLLVEDGPDNQRLITFYLHHAGLDVTLAENGRRAIEEAVAAAGMGLPFDVVLMDMQMPEVDGYAATRAMAAAGLTMPVLALTAHATDDARAQSLAAGCRDHLVKPVDHDALLAAIAVHTAKRDEVARPPGGAWSHDPRFRPLLDAYVAELPAQVAELVELSAGPRAEALRRLLHQIKGAGGGYGMPALSTAAAEAEAAFMGSNVDCLTRSVDELIRLMRSVQGYDRSLESAYGPACSDRRRLAADPPAGGGVAQK